MERNTKQHRAIRQVLAEAGRPLKTDEVLFAARRAVPGLGIATVYRNLTTLIDNGWLQPVELPGEPRRYEPASNGHHPYFHCRVCDRLYDLPESTDLLEALVPQSFELDRGVVLLYGRCPECASVDSTAALPRAMQYADSRSG